MATTEIDLRQAAGSHTLITDNDAARTREASRRRRLTRLVNLVMLLIAILPIRALLHYPAVPTLPSFPDLPPEAIVSMIVGILIGCAIVIPMIASGKSPHIVYRGNDISTTLNDVVGADTIKHEVVRSLNLFLAHQRFSDQMGGAARRGMLFDGPPGTGKTYLAKAMAGSADVPLVFVSATAFQSMYYGATARKIRSYFRTLRKLALEEGGAIGFIEEFDAIGLARSGQKEGRGEGISGVVNELLVQMQSFDEPTISQRVMNGFINRVNRYLPANRQISRRVAPRPNILIIAATNRAEDLDPALLRPGRFDRTITFDLPIRRERAAIAEYYLNRKSHDVTVTSEEVARITSGYSPVMLERMLDEALVCALQRGKQVMGWEDVRQAQLIAELGLARDGEYTATERWRVAVHEMGHAIIAMLLGQDVGVISVLKRGGALGVTTFVDPEERNLHTKADLENRIAICLGGLVAEEIECGSMSSGASSDLAAATSMACMMIGALGMGSSLISVDASASAVTGNLVAKVLSDEKCRTEVDAMLTAAKARVHELLGPRREALRRAASALDAEDEIDGIRLAKIVTPAEVV
jgi:cell division protease FtsH